MLMDISIYVSLIHLRYVFNNVVYRIYIPRCYTNSVGIFDKNIALIFFYYHLWSSLEEMRKRKKITSTAKNLEHMTAKREKERGGGIFTLFPSPGSAPDHQVNTHGLKMSIFIVYQYSSSDSSYSLLSSKMNSSTSHSSQSVSASAFRILSLKETIWKLLMTSVGRP